MFSPSGYSLMVEFSFLIQRSPVQIFISLTNQKLVQENSKVDKYDPTKKILLRCRKPPLNGVRVNFDQGYSGSLAAKLWLLIFGGVATLLRAIITS